MHGFVPDGDFRQTILNGLELDNKVRLIDEQYARIPFYGVPKMLARLKRQGHWVNVKRVI